MTAIFARLRAASAAALLTAVLALGPAPSLSAQGQAPASWAIQYVKFATPSDGWAMAYQNDQSRFTELFTSLDRGRHWHNVTPPVVVAGENDWNHYPHAAVMDPLTPFVLDSRDAWWPVLRSYGQGDQSSELYVYMTSDAGRRWALRGRFPHAELGGLFFLSPSTGFIETETAGGGGARPEDLAQIYATSDGGQHWQEVSVIGPLCEAISGVSFASPRLGFVSGYCGWGPASLARTSDGGREWEGHVIAPENGDGAATYPPVFSSPRLGSMVVEVVPAVFFATTTDAGRHWDLRHLPPPAARLLSADDTCLPGCRDLVSARTWLVGVGHDLYTTTDAGISWKASSPSSMALTNLQLDFLGPRVGWAYEGNIEGDARSDLLWRTTDGGRHWSTYSLGTNAS